MAGLDVINGVPIFGDPKINTAFGALDQAAPLQGWDLPTEFTTLRRLLKGLLSRKNRCANVSRH
jgi:hypothetical protein